MYFASIDSFLFRTYNLPEGLTFSMFYVKHVSNERATYFTSACSSTSSTFFTHTK